MISLPASRRAANPWKNGGGVTREVAAFPPGSGVERFDWRVSIADITEDGPFSVFPGIDRTLILLSGDGIALDIAGHVNRLTQEGEPYSFPADQPAASTLLGGPVVDLNVMSRRGQIAHHVIPVKQAQTLHVEEGVLIWVKGTGRVIGPGGTVELHPFDALQTVSPGAWEIEGEDFLAYYAAFTRLTETR